MIYTLCFAMRGQRVKDAERTYHAYLLFSLINLFGKKISLEDDGHVFGK
jgi:hypothetical protein